MRLCCLLISTQLALILAQSLVIPYDFQDGQRVRILFQHECVYINLYFLQNDTINKLSPDMIISGGSVFLYGRDCQEVNEQEASANEALIYDNGSHWLYSYDTFSCAMVESLRFHDVNTLEISTCSQGTLEVSLVEVCYP